MTDAPTVFIVDDNPGLRASLGALMESAGLAVEAYASAEEFLAAFDPAKPGCLLLDVRLGRASGLDLQERLRQRRVQLPIIIITGYANVPTSVRALKAGAFDFLQKPTSPDVLLDRVRCAVEADRRERERMRDQAAIDERVARLTPRERQVMKLLVEGCTSKEIATRLRLSTRTVEGHRRMVLSKMGVASAAQLVRTVMSGGR
jgi:FixJ family two-component response regulator